MVNAVTDILKNKIGDRNISFVFPSQTAAGLWAHKVCTLGIVRSVAANRFLAWDSFKEEVTEEKQKAPVTAVMRKFFTESLVRKNAPAAANKPDAQSTGMPRAQIPGQPQFPFRSVVPPEYAEQGRIFASYIAGILSSLASWKKQAGKKTIDGKQIFDSEDLDYLLIIREYSEFLERFKLYEPSWEEINIENGNRKYIIFFPELIEDFDEYKDLLLPPRFFLVHEKDAAQNAQSAQSAQDALNLQLYPSVRTEIRSAVLEIQKLHEDGIPYEEMAVSVPELEKMESTLLKEFYLRHIPVTRRAGKPLGETGAGRLWSLVNECAVSKFSFSSIKALVLNEHIPWKDPDSNKDLIRFGIEYNCVAGFLQDGKFRDIWEEAFNEGVKENDRKLKTYYRNLKNAVRAFAGSNNFTEIRRNYFIFKKDFLNMEKISRDDDNVISRCIEELSLLIDLEEQFGDPALIPQQPLNVFISHLNEKEYVTANQNPGVNIFKWRVAAASPFSCHFVLNASQSAATVLYQPLRFLRQDKRKNLGIEDRDATGAFFSLYNMDCSPDNSGRTRISASSRTFSGWAIPHIFFAGGKTIEVSSDLHDHSDGNLYTDPYIDERRFWQNIEAGLLPKIYPLQKRSFENWHQVLVQRENNFSFFESAPADDRVLEILNRAIPQKDGILTVTPTLDLNTFYKCPVSWLYSRIFKAGEFSLEAALLDDTALGSLYHRILETFFGRIKKETGLFNSSYIETYKKWIKEITADEIVKERAFRGPLAVPLVMPQAAGISKKLFSLLENEKKYCDNFSVAELELPVKLRTGDIEISGIIDRVSVSAEGTPVIIDYKTGKLTQQIPFDELDKKPLAEFQMPLYIKLYEEKINAGKSENKIETEGAFFYSINQQKTLQVVGEKARSNSKTINREDYNVILEAADKQINEFAQRIRVFNLAPGKVKISDCLACKFKTACRSAY
ncbi:MAG: PD-(D/E)XK nuclease family protein [Treponema sp.]|nr:PD-(D/E)XK nuclease family protein [Treponema sp.]